KAAVDQAFDVQAHAHRAHGTAALLVHREALARPVDGIAEPAHLARDGAAVLLFPLPDPRHERLTPKVVTGQALFRELPLHYVLGRDPRVIHPREPERAEPLHALAPDDGVLDRMVKRMPDVQRPGDVW